MLTNSMRGVVFNAPIVAIGDAPSDVTTHADTEDRVRCHRYGKR